jgi:ribosomal protein S13
MQTRDFVDVVRIEILKQMTEGIGQDRLEQVIKEINHPTYGVIVLTADEIDALRNAISQTAAASLEPERYYPEPRHMMFNENHFRDRINKIKILAKERGYNASQALGALERTIDRRI